MTSSPRILFVDDDELTRTAFKRALAAYGFEIDTAGSHDQAVDLARQHSYGIVATDYHMPDVNGLELVRRLRPAQPDAAFVLVSGRADLDVTLTAVNDLGVQAVITKPWDAPALAAKLHSLLEARLARESRSDTEAMVVQVHAAADEQRAVLDAALKLAADARGSAVSQELRTLEEEWLTKGRAFFAKLLVLAEQAEANAATRARLADIGKSLSASQARPNPRAAPTPPRDERRSPRVPFVAAVRLRRDGRVSLGQSEDLSQGGMFVATDSLAPVESKLSIEFSLPGRGEVLSCLCRVAWARPEIGARDRHRRSAGLGLEFVALDETTRTTISGFIEHWEDDQETQLGQLFG